MKGKPDLVRAAAIAKAAQGVGGAYVVVTRDQNLPHQENASARLAEYPLAKYSCKECATTFSANAGENFAPHCFACGSAHTEVCSPKKGEIAGTATKVHADSELLHYACDGCGTLNVMHRGVALASSTLHCAACGHSNQVVERADVDDTMPQDSGEGAEGDETLDDLALVDVDDDGLGDDDEADESLEAETEDAIDPVDGTPTTTMDAEGTGTGTPVDADADEFPSDTGVPPASDSLEETIPQNTPVDAAPAAPAAPSVVYSEGDDTMDVDMLSMEEDTPVEELSMVWLRDRIAIANSTQILATLSKEDASAEHAEVMYTEAFAQAIGQTLQDIGLRKTCAHFGFKPAIAKVPVLKVVQAKVEAALAEKAKALTDKLETMASDFEHATEIAAAGVTKNFWRGVNDPLKAQLIAELSAAGIRKPERLVDRVWQAQLAALMQVVLDKGKELAKISTPARNEIAASLDMVTFRPTKVTAADAGEEDVDDDALEDDDDAEGGEDAVESRLVNAASAVPTERQAVHSSVGRGGAGHRVTAGSGRSVIQSILGDRQGHHFNS